MVFTSKPTSVLPRLGSLRLNALSHGVDILFFCFVLFESVRFIAVVLPCLSPSTTFYPFPLSRFRVRVRDRGVAGIYVDTVFVGFEPTLTSLVIARYNHATATPFSFYTAPLPHPPSASHGPATAQQW